MKKVLYEINYVKEGDDLLILINAESKGLFRGDLAEIITKYPKNNWEELENCIYENVVCGAIRVKTKNEFNEEDFINFMKEEGYDFISSELESSTEIKAMKNSTDENGLIHILYNLVDDEEDFSKSMSLVFEDYYKKNSDLYYGDNSLLLNIIKSLPEFPFILYSEIEPNISISKDEIEYMDDGVSEDFSKFEKYGCKFIKENIPVMDYSIYDESTDEISEEDEEITEDEKKKEKGIQTYRANWEKKVRGWGDEIRQNREKYLKKFDFLKEICLSVFNESVDEDGKVHICLYVCDGDKIKKDICQVHYYFSSYRPGIKTPNNDYHLEDNHMLNDVAKIISDALDAESVVINEKKDYEINKVDVIKLNADIIEFIINFPGAEACMQYALLSGTFYSILEDIEIEPIFDYRFRLMEQKCCLSPHGHYDWDYLIKELIERI